MSGDEKPKGLDEMLAEAEGWKGEKDPFAAEEAAQPILPPQTEEKSADQASVDRRRQAIIGSITLALATVVGGGALLTRDGGPGLIPDAIVEQLPENVRLKQQLEQQSKEATESAVAFSGSLTAFAAQFWDKMAWYESPILVGKIAIEAQDGAYEDVLDYWNGEECYPEEFFDDVMTKAGSVIGTDYPKHTAAWAEVLVNYKEAQALAEKAYGTHEELQAKFPEELQGQSMQDLQLVIWGTAKDAVLKEIEDAINEYMK